MVWPGSPSGVVTQVAGLVRAAEKRSNLRHRICFLDGTGEVAEALEAEGLTVCRLGLRRGWGAIGLFRLARVIRSSKPRVLHFHWPALGPIFVGMAAARHSSFVWTEHHPGALFRSLRFKLFYRWFRSRFDRFVVVSEPMKRCVEGYGVEPARIRLIPNGLTIPLRASPRARAEKGRIVGLLTRLDRLKRVELFVDVIAELRARGIDCVGRVVGGGRQQPVVERHAALLGMEDTIEFVGMQADVAAQLDRFDVFLTTTSIESFGLAALEAMARAVPVVAMPCPGGLAELVSRGGVLLPDRDVKTAADAVSELLASPQLREEVGQRGLAVAGDYGLDGTLTALDRLYTELIEDQAAFGTETAR
jgi:glycosyltransferase involved in cell wall biosynthesis